MTGLFRNPIDLGKVFRARRPTDRLDVLLDLLDAGGAGEDPINLQSPVAVSQDTPTACLGSGGRYPRRFPTMVRF